MGSHHDFEYKLIALEEKLESLGHFPSQKEDRVLYANAKYYYTNYPENPIVEDLMRRFPRETSNPQSSHPKMSIEESISYIINKISSLGYIPGPTEDRALYSKVKYCYEHFADHPKIISFKEKYPLERKKKKSIFEGMDLDERIDRLEEELIKFQEVPHIMRYEEYSDRVRLASNALRYYKRLSEHPKIKRLMFLYPTDEFYKNSINRNQKCIDYIRRCIELYNELPGEKTLPMSRLYHTCLHRECKLRMSDGTLDPYVSFVKELGEQDILSPRLKSIYERIN